MQVEIITPDGRPIELSYQVFDAETGNSYGSDYSTDEMSEWGQDFWILPTGRYKVTLNNQPFTTNRDFAAAYATSTTGSTYRYITWWNWEPVGVKPASLKSPAIR